VFRTKLTDRTVFF